MRRGLRRRGRTIAAAVVSVAALASCTTSSPDSEGAYGVQVASYDLAAEGPQRFLVGILGADNALIVGGVVLLDFRFYGAAPTEDDPEVEGELRATDVVAQFTPVAAGAAPPNGAGPREQQGEEGVGVYEALGVEFDDAGFWSVTVRGQVDGEPFESSAAFEVADTHRIPSAGDPAPPSVNLLPGDPDAPVQAVDSRSTPDGAVPDPELHEITVADAIATGRPTLVVVSTPVFCRSRFCGPITDGVQSLVPAYGAAVNFVHIEVWRDFEGDQLNRAAADWIYPDETVDPAEPWVFLIGSDGTISQRWDNVANLADLDQALAEATS